MKDVLETVREITKLIKFSLRRAAIICAVKEEVGPDERFVQHDGLSQTQQCSKHN